MVEIMVVMAVIGILAVAALLNFSTIRTSTALNEATKSIINTAEKARQYSAAGRELTAGIFPSYGVAFDTAEPRDVILFADCLLDDNGDGLITAADDFTFDPARTACGGDSGLVERVRISTNPRVAIRAVRTVSAELQMHDRGAIVYVRPDPTTWVSGADGTVLPYGRLEVVVGDDSGELERVIQFWTSGLIDVVQSGAALAPAVPVLKAGSVQWSNAFKAAVDPIDSLGYAVSDETPLPWGTIDTLYVQFNADPSAPPEASYFTLSGVNTPTYSVSSINYDAATRTAVLTLAAPIRVDRLRLIIRDILPAETEFAGAVLPGDVNRDGTVGQGDVDLLVAGAGWGATIGDEAYNIFVDLDGSGAVDGLDIDWLLSNMGRTLP